MQFSNINVNRNIAWLQADKIGFAVVDILYVKAIIIYEGHPCMWRPSLYVKAILVCEGHPCMWRSSLYVKAILVCEGHSCMWRLSLRHWDFLRGESVYMSYLRRFRPSESRGVPGSLKVCTGPISLTICITLQTLTATAFCVNECHMNHAMSPYKRVKPRPLA
jgi:hypothetical protein